MKKGYLGILVFLLFLSLGIMIFLRNRQPEVVNTLEDFNERLTEPTSEMKLKIDSTEQKFQNLDSSNYQNNR